MDPATKTATPKTATSVAPGGRARWRPHWTVLLCIVLFPVVFLHGRRNRELSAPVNSAALRLGSPARALSDRVTDLKFRLRGPLVPSQPIVIVAIDSQSLETIGRWPWHRDVLAQLTERILDAGARLVGFDMIFAEPDPRTAPALRHELAARGLGWLADAAETDPGFAQTIARHRDRLVLGWYTEQACQPALARFQDCPVSDADRWQSIPRSHARFALTQVQFGKRLQPQKTPVMSAATVVPNIDLFTEAAQHAGHFNGFPSPDGIIRVSYPILFAAGRAHPSLALEMARLAKAEQLALRVGTDQRIESLRFARSGETIPVSETGRLPINFYGPGYTFPYVSARWVLAGDPAALARLRDAYVLIGSTALGGHDMRAFPLDGNVAGIEGHATLLDNLLSGRTLRPPALLREVPAVLVLMTLGALLVAVALQRLGPLLASLSFAVGFIALGVIDVKLWFARGLLLDTGLLYVELFTVFLVSMAVKYYQADSDKKFIRSAFARYVPPAVVDAILADPSRLELGGEKKTLSILFSDLRGFTSISERLDARVLVAFLNEYLGRMTTIVFQHGGTLDKYIGDAVMAFWGAPLPQDDHAPRALAAALAMVRAVDAMRADVKNRWDVDLAIGIGIATGLVSVGNMGSPDNVEYTVIGDRVNLASRLESLTKTYGVCILTTVDTIEELARLGLPPPPHRVLDRVRVKGKQQSVELVEVLPVALTTDEQAGFAAAREQYLAREFSQALAALTELQTRHPQRLYQLLADRCRHFMSNPPPPDWRGEWEMESK